MLEFNDLTVEYMLKGKAHIAAQDIKFRLERGKALGIAGESGCGKTTIARALLGILPHYAIVSGEIIYEGTDILSLPRRERDKLYGKEISMIFQDPGIALNPHRKIRHQLYDILNGTFKGRKCINEQIERNLAAVHLPEPRRVMEQYPSQLSGGMKQRVAIAAAISLNPKLLVADEPTSSLDSSIRRQIIDEIISLKNIHGLSLLYISHDLAELSAVCNDIIIMKNGRVIEAGTKEAILNTPQEPYTKELIAAARR